MSEVNKPFEIFRVSVPDGEYSRRADVIEKLHYDAAQSQLAALREELADITDQCIDHVNLYKAWTKERDDLQSRLADAERRNSELVELLRDVRDMPIGGSIPGSRIDAALNPNPEAASHDE